MHFIVQHSRHRKDNESSETKIQHPDQNKKGKSRIQTYETVKHFAKNGQKFLRTAFTKKNYLFFKNSKEKRLNLLRTK